MSRISKSDIKSDIKSTEPDLICKGLNKNNTKCNKKILNDKYNGYCYLHKSQTPEIISKLQLDFEKKLKLKSEKADLLPEGRVRCVGINENGTRCSKSIDSKNDNYSGFCYTHMGQNKNITFINYALKDPIAVKAMDHLCKT